ncbi:MAG: phosphoribosylformylglycinamidine synthase subunit PurL [Gemmatimonadota bacterium]|nr:phosphoribosylformylglycinamidine synthase subunit PurL [Gemmatimonadota bacterium]
MSGAGTVATRDIEITPELVSEHGLSEHEWELILGIMGRTPTITELGVFSAMWSEHCGYKNSRPLLKTLPTEGERVVQGPGENAGVIDVGDGWGVAFKIESHNHPSAVEPYQGAATGSGGILRDVFTMGARPIALFDSLRFGSLDSPRSRYLLDGVVRGVGDYGNCVGVPTVGGETVFDPAYEKNPLVNVMCVGVLPLERLIRGEARGVGNPVMAVGARTGRDGIHGATFASEELDEENADSRPQVQVGDPFTEKLLLEASLELIERDLLVGIQDMGAAGLTSSGTEMAARSGSGIDIDVSLLPVREEGMTPYEMLLSESQERMLLVAKPEHEDDVREVLERWDLQAATIGRVTDDGFFRVREAGETVCEIPVIPLVDECPTYVREGVEAPEAIAAREMDLSPYRIFEDDAALRDALETLLDAPSIGSRRWIHEQYDTTVQTNTLEGPGSDAAVLRLPGGNRALAASTDGNGRYTYLGARTGGRIAVAEAARNVACTGARPVAITNCLNFGSPLRPSVYYQLSEAVAGMGEACRALGTPVTGGNVSLYNETGGSPVYPTPVIGMLGLLDDLDRRVPSHFQEPGDRVLVVGRTRDEIGASEYLAACHGMVAGPPPALDLDEAAALIDFLVEAADAGVLRSAHDCSDGGLAIALAECAILADDGSTGVSVDLDGAPGAADTSPAALWFGESQSRAVVTCTSAEEVEEIAARHGVPVAEIGSVGERGADWTVQGGGHRVTAAVADLRRVFENALPRRMREQAGLTS